MPENVFDKPRLSGVTFVCTSHHVLYGTFFLPGRFMNGGRELLGDLTG